MPVQDRKMISVLMTGEEVIATMSEGNPGALRVLTDLLSFIQGGAGLLCILALDDMNIRGSQIWVAYKNYAEVELEKMAEGFGPFVKGKTPEDYNRRVLKILIEACKQRSPELVEVVNRESGYPEYYPHEAVTKGAAWKRDPEAAKSASEFLAELMRGAKKTNDS